MNRVRRPALPSKRVQVEGNFVHRQPVRNRQNGKSLPIPKANALGDVACHQPTFFI